MAQTGRGVPGTSRTPGELFYVGAAGRPVASRDPEQCCRATGQPDGQTDHPGAGVAGLGGVSHDLSGTGCGREGVPFDEDGSSGDAVACTDGGHAEGISLHHVHQPDPPNAVAETHEGYRPAESLYARGNAAGTGKDQEDPAGKRGDHHDRDLETAADDPGGAGTMCLIHREVRVLNSPGSQDTINAKYTWDSITRMYEECYRKVLQGE